MNITGMVIAVATFLCIGTFHTIVIKAEYYFTKKCWVVFLAVGIVLIGLSLWLSHFLISSVLGIIGCCCLWSIFELFEQEKRVERGQFPKRQRAAVKDKSRKVYAERE